MLLVCIDFYLIHFADENTCVYHRLQYDCMRNVKHRPLIVFVCFSWSNSMINSEP